MEPVLRFCICETAQKKGQERKEKIGRKENKGKEHSCELRMQEAKKAAQPPPLMLRTMPGPRMSRGCLCSSAVAGEIRPLVCCARVVSLIISITGTWSRAVAALPHSFADGSLKK